jgi:hypothetical protein
VEDETEPLALANYLAPSLLPVYHAVAERITRTIGRPVLLLEGSSFGQFASGEVDFGFI